MASVSVVVVGRVQGVGFRAFVSRLARELGVVGEVWNRRDGCVEALAIHEDSDVLVTFCRRLEFGPGYVKNVLHSPGPDNLSAEEFEIGFTR